MDAYPPLSFRAGLWRLADPKISLASIASIFLGAAAARAAGPLDWTWLAFTLAGIFAIEVAKNASGEVIDFDSGTDLAIDTDDRSPFSGGKRVLVDRLLTRCQTWGIAIAGYAVGAGLGFLIVGLREPRILWIGIFGVTCAFFYHAPPLKLSYRGLGELAVALCYGPLICAGTYLVQRQNLPPQILWLACPLGLLIAAFLWINEFPDRLADQAAGKRTLVVTLGPARASQAFAGLVGLSLILLLALPAAGLPQTVYLGAVAFIPAFQAARRLLQSPTVTRDILPAQAQTLLAFVLYALGAGLGLLLAPSNPAFP